MPDDDKTLQLTTGCGCVQCRAATLTSVAVWCSKNAADAIDVLTHAMIVQLDANGLTREECQTYMGEAFDTYKRGLAAQTARTH